MTGSVMSVVGVGLGMFIMLGGFTLIFFSDKGKKIEAQRDYEKEFVRRNYRFLRRYENNSTRAQYLPLTFEQQYMNDLSTLCQHYKLYKTKKWSPKYYVRKLSEKEYQPEVERQYLAFRRIEPTDILIPIEVIRCGQKYAIITAENSHSGYLLKKSKYEYKNIVVGLIFHIQAKFVCDDDASHRAGSVHDTDHIETSETETSDEFFSATSGSVRNSPDTHLNHT